ncbi:leucyl aminopeptidase family protein [Lederbergia citrea]|uniref:Probable cytosol aminopeptidase n=1 Tax=Lederbergia citrea TaxID=2833581 RepID=A0A942ULB2_9BACI|nr:leucyl aminopeptidase family protein [Lederbergia citrea]MBS4177936.1 leucyl aminopeptidase family protein [Lederbergia citrea]MBS4223551.1 leucyl aminopeptidase family protein [Lederbergia citrea]
MTTKAIIKFANHSRIEKDVQLKSFIENSNGGFSTVLLDGSIYAIIKPFKKGKNTYEEVRKIAGSIARELSARKVDSALIEGVTLESGLPELDKGKAVSAFVEGWELGSYQFLTYKSDKKPFRTELELAGFDDVKPSLIEGNIRAQAVAFSRDLMNEVPNVLNPETFPEVLEETFKDAGVEINVFRKSKLEEMEMHGVLSVCRGSKYEPAFVEIIYRGDETKPLVALVGKGVTFDTGGISLKSGRDLSDMRMDMGGAAAVAGAMKILVESKAKVNVAALIPIVENMPDNLSLLPSEIIRYKNGLTVQVGNTDAEGRLILADGLIRAGELNAEYIVNIATLTGAIANALGSKIAGVFGDEELAVEMKNIGAENGDHVWPMPLVDAYDSYLNSDYADISNIGSKGEAGSITAGLFLRRFVPKTAKWLHVDMAGVMASSQATGYYPKSATGYGARLLADYTTYVSK